MESTVTTADKHQPFWTSLECFFVLVVVYFVAPSLSLYHDEPSFIELVLKCAPIFCLIYFAKVNGLDRWRNKKPYYNYSKHILYGLFCCVIGDALLIWDSLFFHGVVAFMLGHINYIIAFGCKPVRRFIAVITYTIACAMITVFYNELSGILLIAIPLYTLVIATMVWRAAARLPVVNFKYQLATLTGSVLFAFSDSVLAINKFVLQFDYAQVIIMCSYYAAQLLIGLGVLDPRRPKD